MPYGLKGYRAIGGEAPLNAPRGYIFGGTPILYPTNSSPGGGGGGGPGYCCKFIEIVDWQALAVQTESQPMHLAEIVR